jgi:hypothetical protein
MAAPARLSETDCAAPAAASARLGIRQNTLGASVLSGLQAIRRVSVVGFVGAPGVRVYQVWFRDAQSFCTPSTFNLTGRGRKNRLGRGIGRAVWKREFSALHRAVAQARVRAARSSPDGDARGELRARARRLRVVAVRRERLDRDAVPRVESQATMPRQRVELRRRRLRRGRSRRRPRSAGARPCRRLVFVSPAKRGSRPSSTVPSGAIDQW